ncbi:MAG: cysteine synthase family protein [Planctomycetes bacterium]|nr:cysteine synthase family protein [Planctomycetota bacterium]
MPDRTIDHSSVSGIGSYPKTVEQKGNTATSRPSPVDRLSALVGGTPLLEIHYTLDNRPGRIFAKYELMNMTGSIKDRMALHIIRRAYESGDLESGDTIVEATSGNTGISFAAIGRALGHPVRIYMPDWMSRERVQLIQNFGASIIPVSLEQGGFIGAMDMSQDYAVEHDGVFLPQQFSHPANAEAHELYTGPEIEAQLHELGREADAFVAGVGTGGTVMGVGRYLRREGRAVAVHPLEPANSPTLRTGCKLGCHRIQGISDEFVPSIVDLEMLDRVIDAWDGDSILMAQALCGTLGLAVGISSGANVLGAIELAEKHGPEATVVTVLPDSNKKYLSTALCQEEPIRDDYLTPRIRLDRFHAVS